MTKKLGELTVKELAAFCLKHEECGADCPLYNPEYEGESVYDVECELEYAPVCWDLEIEIYKEAKNGK
ncbi:MAG: hypothetical protein LIO57_04150 [Oscillospiraceae bacterium]|nr:hypothetical protein [Oscillospiraceae bacterium]